MFECAECGRLYHRQDDRNTHEWEHDNDHEEDDYDDEDEFYE